MYQHTVLHAGRAIRIGICFAVQMRRRIVYCTLGVQYVLLDDVATPTQRDNTAGAPHDVADLDPPIREDQTSYQEVEWGISEQ